MLDIFISYSHEDQAIVKTLAQDFVSLGHKVWFDQDLIGGKVWWDQILAKIRECDLFVFVLSPNSLDSYACNNECSYAVALNKRILPVLVNDDVSINLLPSNLSAIQYVDYRLQDRQAVLSIVKAVQNLPTLVAMPNPLPAPPDVPISDLGNLKTKIVSQAPLSFEEQTALVIKIKEYLSNLKERDDALLLLSRLRRRDDLFAKVGKEIDDLLGISKTTPIAKNAEYKEKITENIKKVPDTDFDNKWLGKGISLFMILLLLIITIFQNFYVITISLLSWQTEIPMSILKIGCLIVGWIIWPSKHQSKGFKTISLFVGALIFFVLLQNNDLISYDLLFWQITVPLFVIIIGFVILGWIMRRISRGFFKNKKLFTSVQKGT